MTLFHVCADYLCNIFTAEGSAVLLEIMITNGKKLCSSVVYCSVSVACPMVVISKRDPGN